MSDDEATRTRPDRLRGCDRSRLRRWQRGERDTDLANDHDARERTSRAGAGGPLDSYRQPPSLGLRALEQPDPILGRAIDQGTRPRGATDRGGGPQEAGHPGPAAFRSVPGRLDPPRPVVHERNSDRARTAACSPTPTERNARWPLGRAERARAHRTATPGSHESVRGLEGRAPGLSRLVLAAFVAAIRFTRARGRRTSRHRGQGPARNHAGLLLTADRPRSSEDRGVDRRRRRYAVASGATRIAAAFAHRPAPCEGRRRRRSSPPRPLSSSRLGLRSSSGSTAVWARELLVPGRAGPRLHLRAGLRPPLLHARGPGRRARRPGGRSRRDRSVRRRSTPAPARPHSHVAERDGSHGDRFVVLARPGS